MKLIVVHDGAGKIIGRIAMSDDREAANYTNRIEIDEEDSNSEPERWAEVDIETKTLRPKAGQSDPTSKKRRRPGE